jgi:hypothetical protein
MTVNGFPNPPNRTSLVDFQGVITIKEEGS